VARAVCVHHLTKSQDTDGDGHYFVAGFGILCRPGQYFNLIVSYYSDTKKTIHTTAATTISATTTTTTTSTTTTTAIHATATIMHNARLSLRSAHTFRCLDNDHVAILLSCNEIVVMLYAFTT
jgi:hypothetical protein